MEERNILEYLKRSTKAKDNIAEWKYNYFFQNSDKGNKDMEENLTDREINRLTSLICSVEAVLKDKKEELHRKKVKKQILELKQGIRAYFTRSGKDIVSEIYRRLTKDQGYGVRIMKRYIPSEGILEKIIHDKLEFWLETELLENDTIGTISNKITALLVNEILKGYGIDVYSLRYRWGRWSETIFGNKKNDLDKDREVFHFTEIIHIRNDGKYIFMYKTNKGEELIHSVLAIPTKDKEYASAEEQVIEVIAAGGKKDWMAWVKKAEKGEKYTQVTLEVIVPNGQEGIVPLTSKEDYIDNVAKREAI